MNSRIGRFEVTVQPAEGRRVGRRRRRLGDGGELDGPGEPRDRRFLIDGDIYAEPQAVPAETHTEAVRKTKIGGQYQRGA